MSAHGTPHMLAWSMTKIAPSCQLALAAPCGQSVRSLSISYQFVRRMNVLPATQKSEKLATATTKSASLRVYVLHGERLAASARCSSMAYW